MTPQDLQNAARKYFDLSKVAITMLHPSNTVAEALISNYNKTKNLTFTGALKKQAYHIDSVKQYKLPNNYKVLTYDSNLPDAYAAVVLSPEQPIIAKNSSAYAVLNEILENGTMFKNNEAFSRKLEKDGTAIDINVDRYGLRAMFNSDVADFDKANETFKELLENPRFTQETFDKAVRDVSDRISRSEKSPYNKLNPELDKNAHTKEEILAGLNTITLDEVKQLYSDLRNNARGICSVAAPFGTNPELKNRMFAHFAELSQVKEYQPILRDDFSPIEKTRVLTDVDNKPQAKIVMAYKFTRNGNIKDEAAIKLMNIIFGGGPTSRLFNDLREKQHLAYSVKSSINEKDKTGTMTLVIGTTTDNKSTGEKSYENLQKSIDGFKNNIDKIVSEKVSEEELEKAKRSLKDAILSSNEKTISKNNSILAASGSWYGANYFNQLLDTIDTITVEDIYNTANHIFAGKPVYSIVATQDTLNYNKDYLNKLEQN